MVQWDKFGIYISAKTGQVVRITSPYWIPQPPDWVLLTTEVNATLVEVRRLAKQKRLVKEPDTLQWASIPARPE